MSGKRAKQLRELARKQASKMVMSLHGKCVFGRGTPDLWRRIKKDYATHRIDKNLRPVGI